MKLKEFLRNKIKHKKVNLIPDLDEEVYTTSLRDFTVEEIEEIKYVEEFTMTSPERLVALSRSLQYLIENKIEGDIVECGVWRGGSMMLVAKKLMELDNSERKLYLFDTYEGMPQPGEEDVSWNNTDAKILFDNFNNKSEKEGWCLSKLDEVKRNLNKTKYPSKNIKYIVGKVENTLPDSSIEKVALLRLDTDWYESTKHELYSLYDKLVIGGVLIIDDYGHWQGAKKAVDEFIKERKLKLFLNRIDYTGRLAIKLND